MSETNYLFKENQYFRQWWLWIIFLMVFSVFLIGIYQQKIRGVPFGDKPMSDSGLILATLLYALVMLVFYRMGITTLIDEKGIYIRFFPFHLKYKFFEWNEIEKAYIRTYQPIREYGGWGLKGGSMGLAYNVSGDKGLQLELKNGKKILIGTQQPEALQKILLQINK